MTTPSLPAQIEAVREPGWYWVRVFEGAPWHPYHWYHSRDGEAFWIGRAVDDEPMAEIGPRIPDSVTLQQHERTVSERDTAQTICGEAYQAVGALAHYMGLSDHPDIIRLMDNLARHDNPPHQTLLPGPKEDLPNIRQQHERLKQQCSDLKANIHDVIGALEEAKRQNNRLEAEVARLSETAGEDYAVGVQSGMKLSADHIERLEAALRVVLSYAEAQPPNAFERINAVARAALDADETRKSPLR